MNFGRAAHYLVVTAIVLYLILAFRVVGDYGITFDEPENFAVGHKYLNYYLTGQLVFSDDNPIINEHPNFYNSLFKDYPYRYGSFANILSAVSCYLFFQKFQILDAISAHHIIIPILTAFFLYCFFIFAKNYWGNYVGFFSVLLLITYPRFFGDTFNNIKDVPMLIFSSIAIMAFAHWYCRKQTRYFYFAFLFFGIALATRLDNVFLAVIIILWLSLCFIINHPRRYFFDKKTIVSFIAGLLIIFTVFVIFYPPLLPWQSDKGIFIAKVWEYGLQVGVAKNTPWNMYPLLQVLYVTPIPIIIFFLTGLFYLLAQIFHSPAYRGQMRIDSGSSLRNGFMHSNPAIDAVKINDSNRMNLLLLIWVAFPLFRYCLPGSINSDGIRKFLIFIVPFSIIASIGAKMIVGRICFKIKTARLPLMLFLSALALIPNIYALISGHPYQNTYYNYWAGGLKGAQEKGIPFSCDYWLNSYREAGKWLEKNARANTTVTAFPYPDLMQYYITRRDLVCSSSFDIVFTRCYFVLVPRKWWPMIAYHDISRYLVKLSGCQIVHQIKRQGGTIATIYYCP